MNEKLLFECSINILERNVGVKIYKRDNGIFFYTLSDYFQNDGEIDVYIPGDASGADSLDALLFRINFYKNYFKKIVGSKHNDSF